MTSCRDEASRAARARARRLIVGLAAAVAAVLLPGRRIREEAPDAAPRARAAAGPSLPAAGRVDAASATPTGVSSVGETRDPLNRMVLGT